MIYTDSLGNLVPTAGISHFGGSYGRGGYLALHTTAKTNPDAGKRWDNNPDDIAGIAAWADAHGYDIAEGRDGYGAYRASLTHRETAAAIAERRAEAKVGYVRYGDLPKTGKSKNHHTGETETGVSVYEAYFYPDGTYELKTNTAMMRSLISGGLLSRNVLRVYGERVGTGSDGEPVVRVERTELLG